MKKWETKSSTKIQEKNGTIADLIDLLLENRGVTTKKEKENFLHPKLEDVTPKNVGIDARELKKALKRIQKAIETKEHIVVFGDYDVDGITGAAILWETLHTLGANVLPYIPHRIDEGYGLSVVGIENLLGENAKTKEVKLIITVDNGIVAGKAVEFANQKNIDVIITDHHVGDTILPDAHAIVHTTKLCGAGVAYLLSKELGDPVEDAHLELATLGTVADLVPLTGANRAIVKHGLPKVANSKRRGLQAIYKSAGIIKEDFSTYEIGYQIAPRLNASGRLESAMDSLRLLCTTSKERAAELAAKLESINKERQLLLKDSKEHAISGVRTEGLGVRKLLFIAHESYQEGVIGLVAGKLVEEFYRPSIVIAKREKLSKASARSISGFNLIEFLRMHVAHFVNVGGHPMAAGFTVETAKIGVLQKALEKKAAELLTDNLLIRNVKIDCELPFVLLSKKLFDALQQLAPFGMGNPEPVFATKGVEVADIRIIGKEGIHLKLQLRQDNATFEAVGFGMGELASEIHTGDTIDVAYALDENTWNGSTKLQLKIKDIQTRPVVVT